MITWTPIGLPQIIFALALCGFALWKKDWIRVLLAICIIIWGAFALPYDIKIAVSLVSLGAILLFSGIFNVIQKQRGTA